MPLISTNYKPDISVIVLGMAITVLFPLVLSMFIVGFLDGDVLQIVISRSMYWLELGLIFLYARKLERQPFLLWNQTNYPGYFYFFWIPALLVLAFGTLVLSAIPGILGFHDSSILMSHWLAIVTANWGLLLACALTPAITEELLFRGYLLSRLQMLFNNKWLAILVSALLFSNLHFKLFSLRETLFSFLIGLLMGIHYQYFRNIYVVIIVRFLINMVVFILFREHLLKLKF